MSRKLWIGASAAALLAVLVAAAGVAALVFVPRYRAMQNITQARQYAEQGELDQARRHFQEYLHQNDDDLQAYEEYIEVCKRFKSDRRRSLLAAGRAYVRLAQKDPENPERKGDAIDFYREHRFWPELESTIILFYGSERDALDDAMAYERAIAVDEQGRNAAAIKEYEAYLGRTGPRQDVALRDVPLRLARLYQSQGRARDAEALFSDQLEAHPEDAGLRVQYASYLMDRGELEEAETQLEAAGTPADIQHLLAAARLAAFQNDSERALALSEEAVALDPDHGDAHLSYTLALERNGQREAAMAHVESLDPLFRIDAPGFMMLLVELKIEEGAIDEADAIRAEYVRAYPDQRYLDEYLRGRIAFARGKDDASNYEQAREHFMIAVEMNPGLDRARFYLAVTDLELGNERSARNMLDQYLKSNPEDEQARRLWARYFGEGKSLLELRFAGRRLLGESDPALDGLLQTAREIMTHGREEDVDLTRQLLEKAIERDPERAESYRLLAAFHLDRGAADRAEQVLASAAAAGVDGTNFPRLNSNILLIRGDSEAAVELARENLADASFEDVRTWAITFARHGYLADADELLAAYSGQADTRSAAAEAMAFRVTLAVEYGTLDSARALLEEAEADLAGDSDRTATLNEIRLSFARGLISRAPGEKAEIAELLDRVESSGQNKDALVLARARLLLARELPDYDQANTLAARVQEDSRMYEDALLLRAEVAYRRGRLHDVVRITEEILSFSRRNIAALYMLGEAQLGLRRLAEARETMERILEVDRNHLEAMRLLVRIYWDLALPDRAREMLARYEAALAATPGQSRDAEDLRAYLARDESERAASEERLRQTVERDPDNYAAVTGLARTLMMRGAHDEAIAAIESYVERNRNQAQPWVFLGQAILDQGPEADLSAASTAFTRAQIIVPEHGAAQLGLVEVQTRLGNHELAISMCRRYLANRGDDVDVLFRLATLLSRNPANHAEALEVADRAMAIRERPDIIRLRAYLYTELERYGEAIEDLASLSEQVTADDELTLAHAYAGLAQMEKAREHLAAARERISAGDTRLNTRARYVASILEEEGGGQ